MVVFGLRNQKLTLGHNASGAKGRWFESTRAYHIPKNLPLRSRMTGALHRATLPRILRHPCVHSPGGSGHVLSGHEATRERMPNPGERAPH
jgi:hypothetical protein